MRYECFGSRTSSEVSPQTNEVNRLSSGAMLSRVLCKIRFCQDYRESMIVCKNNKTLQRSHAFAVVWQGIPSRTGAAKAWHPKLDSSAMTFSVQGHLGASRKLGHGCFRGTLGGSCH